MTTPAIGIVSMPDDNRADRGDTVRFGTINPPTLAQTKVDDRGAGVTSERLIEHAATVLANVPPVPELGCGRPWCTGHAVAIVGPGDRDCTVDAPNAADGEMPLSHYGDGDYLSVSMFQSPSEVAPRIQVGKFLDGEYVSPWLRLTPHEALTVAMLLDTTAILGDKPLPIGPAPERAPFWLDGPCPGWCLGGHSARDMYDDRVHAGGLTEVPLTLVDAVDGEQSVVVVAMHRHYRSSASVIEVEVSGAGVVSLSSGEAHVLAGHLRDLALLASARPVMAAQVAPPQAAPAWATDSTTGDPGVVFHTGHIGAVTITDATGRRDHTIEVLVERDDNNGTRSRTGLRVDENEMTPAEARAVAALMVKAAYIADADNGAL